MNTIHNCIYPQVVTYAKELLQNTDINASVVNESLDTTNISMSNTSLTIHQKFKELNYIPLFWPDNVFMSGGLLSTYITNPDLHAIHNDTQLLKSDIDIYILGSVEEKKIYVKKIIEFLNRNADKKSDRNNVKIIGWTGSVLYIITDYEPRIYQLILMDAKYKNARQVIAEFDLDYVAIYYNGESVVITDQAAKALYTRVTNYKPTHELLSKIIYRGFKAITRGYKINKESTANINIKNIDVSRINCINLEHFDYANDYESAYISGYTSAYAGECASDYASAYEREYANNLDVIEVNDYYKFNDTFNWDFGTLYKYEICKHYYSSKYITYNDMHNNVIDGIIDMSDICNYYSTEYKIKNILATHELDENIYNDNKLHITNLKLSCIKWYGFKRISDYDKSSNMVMSTAIDMEINENAITNNKIYNDKLHDAQFKILHSEYTNNYILDDNILITIRGKLKEYTESRRRTDDTKMYIEFILNENSRANLFNLNKEIYKYFISDDCINKLINTAGFPVGFKKKKTLSTTLTNLKTAQFIKAAPYVIKIPCDIDNFTKLYHINVGDEISLCVSHTCLLNLPTGVVYIYNRYTLHNTQPYLNMRKSNPNKHLAPKIAPINQRLNHTDRTTDLQSKSIVYDLTNQLQNKGNLETIKKIPIPVSSTSSEPSDDEKLNKWVNDNFRPNTQHINYTYEKLTDETPITDITPKIDNFVKYYGIDNLLCHKLANNIRLLIEFKAPPSYIRHGNNLHYKNEIIKICLQTRSEIRPDLYDECMHIFELPKTYYIHQYSGICGLVGELTDESYKNIQHIIKAINPLGYGSERYNKIDDFYNCRAEFGNKPNLVFIASQSNVIHNKTKYLVTLSTYPMHIRINETNRININITIPQLLLFHGDDFQNANYCNNLNIITKQELTDNDIAYDIYPHDKLIDKLPYFIENHIFEHYIKEIYRPNTQFNIVNCYLQIYLNLNTQNKTKQNIISYGIISDNNNRPSQYTQCSYSKTKTNIKYQGHTTELPCHLRDIPIGHSLPYIGINNIDEHISHYKQLYVDAVYEICSEYIPFELIEIINSYLLPSNYISIHFQ